MPTERKHDRNPRPDDSGRRYDDPVRLPETPGDDPEQPGRRRQDQPGPTRENPDRPHKETEISAGSESPALGGRWQAEREPQSTPRRGNQRPGRGRGKKGRR